VAAEANRHLAVGVPQVVVVRQLLVGAGALVLAVLPGQRPPLAVARGGGGGGWRRGRGRRAAALVAAFRQAVVAVAVRAAPPLLPAGLGDRIRIRGAGFTRLVLWPEGRVSRPGSGARPGLCAEGCTAEAAREQAV